MDTGASNCGLRRRLFATMVLEGHLEKSTGRSEKSTAHPRKSTAHPGKVYGTIPKVDGDPKPKFDTNLDNSTVVRH
eukprot:4100968-Alexandrium_andersonii.AAC.1